MSNRECDSIVAAGWPMRAALAAAGLVAMAIWPGSAAFAQEMKAPVGDIDLTIGAGAGSGPDITQRNVAAILNEEGIVPNPIVVNNRTGGGWTVATNYVLSHAGDENLLMGVSPTVYATPLMQGLPNAWEQLTPLATLLAADHLIVVKADSEINTLTDFMEAAKAEEFAVSMAGANIGSTDSIVNSLLETTGGVKINYIPYDGGGGQIVSALLGGAVTAITIPPDEIMSLIKSNEVKPIALLADERNPAEDLKDIPTAKEQGFDVVWQSTQSIALPPDADPALVAWWDDKLQKMAATERWQKMLSDNYLVEAYKPASEAKAGMQAIFDQYHSALTDLGLVKAPE